MKLALVQTKRIKELAQLGEVVDELYTITADLVLMPENWVAEVLKDPLDVLSKFPPFKLLVPGAFYVADGGEVYSRSYLLAGGKIVDYCEKLFPSSATDEDRRVKSGRKLCSTELDWAKVGVVICVDLMMPEIARKYALGGVNIILNPANITADRIWLWKSVVLTRAFENHIYVAFANNTNAMYPDGRLVKGGSAAASPNGYIVGEMGEEEGVLYVELNYEEIEYARRRRRFLEKIREFNEASLRL